MPALPFPAWLRFPHRATHADCCLRFPAAEPSSAIWCPSLFPKESRPLLLFCQALNLSPVLFVLRKTIYFRFSICIVAVLRVSSAPVDSTTGCLSQPLKSAPIPSSCARAPLALSDPEPRPRERRNDQRQQPPTDDNGNTSDHAVPQPHNKHHSTGSVVCHAAAFTRSCLAPSLPPGHPLRSAPPTNPAPFGYRLTTAHSSAVALKSEETSTVSDDSPFPSTNYHNVALHVARRQRRRRP